MVFPRIRPDEALSEAVPLSARASHRTMSAWGRPMGLSNCAGLGRLGGGEEGVCLCWSRLKHNEGTKLLFVVVLAVETVDYVHRWTVCACVWLTGILWTHRDPGSFWIFVQG